MIGRLRQVSEPQLESYKSNPADLARALAVASPALGDLQQYSQLRDALQQSPVVQEMMALAAKSQLPTREQQLEFQREMSQLMKHAQGGFRPGSSKAKSLAPADSLEDLNLHKSWHCLHFLLAGNAEGPDGSPLGDAILGGEEIGGEAADTGYGPPRALAAARVKEIAASLRDFPIDQKTGRYDPEAAERAGIYVAQHGAEELQANFLRLREFYADAAAKGNAVLLWIS